MLCHQKQSKGPSITYTYIIITYVLKQILLKLITREFEVRLVVQGSYLFHTKILSNINKFTTKKGVYTVYKPNKSLALQW